MKREKLTSRLLLASVMLCSSLAGLATQGSGKNEIRPGNVQMTMKLPLPKNDGSTSVERALHIRRSVRDFSGDPLTLGEVSQILWSAQGTTEGGYRKTAPSAGALYPLEVYLLAGNVGGLPAGIYTYKARTHELEAIVQGDRRTELCNAALGQPSIRRAPAVVVLSAVYERTTSKYGERGIRYVHMEAGHAAQNISLQAVSLGLGTVVIGAFRDDAVKKVLAMADGEAPLYIVPVGRK